MSLFTCEYVVYAIGVIWLTFIVIDNTWSEMEKAIKIAQIQKRPKNISTISIIYADSTGAGSSGADDTVSKALFAHSFPRSGPKN